MFLLPMHDVRPAVDIGVHEILEICLAGIGPNGEVHILADQQIQFVEVTLVVREPPATDQFLDLPRSDHGPAGPIAGSPTPIMWPSIFICRFLHRVGTRCPVCFSDNAG
jgi:hypothetical protein